MKTIKTTVISIVLCSMVTIVFSQESRYEKLKKQKQLEYQEKLANKQLEYTSKRDKEFAEFLKGSWKSYDKFRALELPEKPKPTLAPIYPIDQKRENDVEIKIIGQPEKEETLEPMVLPVEKKESSSYYMHQKYSFAFYGKKLNVDVDKTLIPTQSFYRIDNDMIGDFWATISDADYSYTLNQTLYQKELLNLNDWGYFQLIRKLSDKLANGDKNKSKLLTWFFMVKAGYNVKIGYNQNTIVVLVPTSCELYGVNYYTLGGTKFYALDSSNDQIMSYNKEYPGATKYLEMTIKSPPNLGENITAKTLYYNYNNQQVPIELRYNQNMISFYNDFPLMAIETYFNSRMSVQAKESITNSLNPLLAGKSETEAVGLLLDFVQKSFEYKTDAEQFGREKFYFPEEVLHYPFSDCEDRSVFFAYLVQELLKLKVIGLEYHDHVATAVKFTNYLGGDYIEYNKEKYVICDPTFINAPLGRIMPKYMNELASVVELENTEQQHNLIDQIWTYLSEYGVYPGNHKNNAVQDEQGNAYVTGYITKPVSISNYNLSPIKNSRDIFVGKFDKDMNLVWAKQSKGNGNNSGNCVILDEDKQCLVSAIIEKDLEIDNKYFNLGENKDYLIMKIDSEGDIVWAQNTETYKNQEKEGNMVVASLNSAGQKESIEYYHEDEYFEDYGIKTDKNGNVYLVDHQPDAMVAKSDVASYESSANFSTIEALHKESDFFIGENYEKTIAGLFAVINLVQSGNHVIEGKSAQMAIDAYSPGFKEEAPVIYKNIGNLQFIKNDDGIISIKNVNGKDVFFNKMKIKDDAKIRIVQYKSGNAQVNVLSGISVGKAIIWYNLNYVKLYKDDGNMLFDYDNDNSQVVMNLKKDILY